jgi:hypothetical protein
LDSPFAYVLILRKLSAAPLQLSEHGQIQLIELLIGEVFYRVVDGRSSAAGLQKQRQVRDKPGNPQHQFLIQQNACARVLDHTEGTM